MSTSTTSSTSTTTTATTTSNLASKTLVIDNGAHSIKIAYANSQSSADTSNLIQPIVIPNQVGKTKKEKKYILGDDLAKFHNASEIRLRNPMDHGYICSWGIEKEIWDYLFKRDDLKVKPSETNLLMTEAPFAMDDIRKALYETVYEQYKFKSLCLTSSSTLGLLNYKSENTTLPIYSSPCHLVVDCGYSSTHIVPHFLGNRLNYAVKRVNVGGKILTNYLKEIVSFRYWDMMHETRLINTIKERVCYISQDFMGDLMKCKDESSSITVDYVLPDYRNNNNTGFIKNEPYYPVSITKKSYFGHPNKHQKEQKEEEEEKDNTDEQDKEMTDDQETTNTTTTEEPEEQILELTNERFTVPELLFNPSDIGINQGGIAESIVQSINSTNINMHQPLYSNILLLGGSTLYPGFKERLENDLRKLAPDDLPIKIYTTEDPIMAPVYGGMKMALQNDFSRLSVTKAEYEEHGYILCNRKFN
ncbi:actin related protein 6 [Cavenderia fasciculata]|uniref:Actin related protein 6 n=1 Tax=Cavenderia fasciculata TaxID=261658 RepID=F4PWQ1_CACFS|nr:actin related protein 6 [Cavenderia fasciculata]EGG20415.1 actin related protein 6 [Cavenderia fasciculata]|eukprot:XP_004367398.1 actin related protein 6 [Cavenderia fasciculata]